MREQYNWDRTQAPLYLTNKRIIPNDDSFMANTKEFLREKEDCVAAFFFTAAATKCNNILIQRSEQLNKAYECEQTQAGKQTFHSK